MKYIFFDLDGTIIDTEKAFSMCFLDVLNNKYGCHAKYEDYVKYELNSNTELINHFRLINDKLKNVKNSDVMNLIYKKYENYFKECINSDESINNFKLINSLYDREYHLALITTCKREYLNILDIVLLKNLKISLYKLFDYVVAREDIAEKELKPNPLCYNMALTYFGIESSEAIAIEDAKRGIDSSINAGIKTIQVKEYNILKNIDNRCIQYNSVSDYIKEILDKNK